VSARVATYVIVFFRDGQIDCRPLDTGVFFDYDLSENKIIRGVYIARGKTDRDMALSNAESLFAPQTTGGKIELL
jgi:hypothetical protein